MTEGRILVVDDEKKIVESCRLYLEHAGFEVVCAYNGEQALEEARESRPDLIVLDLMLPRVDGRTDGAEPGKPQYFVFFRDAEDRWSEGVCLGRDVSPVGGNAGSAFVSPDGKYFFFGSTKPRETASTPEKPLTLQVLRDAQSRARNGNLDIYWMQASFLDTLRPARNE